MVFCVCAPIFPTAVASQPHTQGYLEALFLFLTLTLTFWVFASISSIDAVELDNLYTIWCNTYLCDTQTQNIWWVKHYRNLLLIQTNSKLDISNCWVAQWCSIFPCCAFIIVYHASQRCLVYAHEREWKGAWRFILKRVLCTQPGVAHINSAHVPLASTQWHGHK